MRSRLDLETVSPKVQGGRVRGRSRAGRGDHGLEYGGLRSLLSFFGPVLGSDRSLWGGGLGSSASCLLGPILSSHLSLQGAGLGGAKSCLASAPLLLLDFLLLARGYNLRKVPAEAPSGGLAPLIAIAHGERVSALQEGLREVLLLEPVFFDNILDPVLRGPRDELLAVICGYNAQDGLVGMVEQQDVVVGVWAQAFARDVFAHVQETRFNYRIDELHLLQHEQHLPAHAF